MRERILLVSIIILTLFIVISPTSHNSSFRTCSDGSIPDTIFQLAEIAPTAKVDKYNHTFGSGTITDTVYFEITYTKNRTIVFWQIHSSSSILGSEDDTEDHWFTWEWDAIDSGLIFTRGDGNREVDLDIWVVEFAEWTGVEVTIPSIQHAPGTYSIGRAVNMSETFLIVCGNTATSMATYPGDFASVYLSSTTQYTIASECKSDSFSNVRVQIVSMPGCFVQRGRTVLPDDQFWIAESISPIEVSRTTILCIGLPGSTEISPIEWGPYTTTASIYGSDLYFERGRITNQNETLILRWQVIEWPSWMETIQQGWTIYPGDEYIDLSNPATYPNNSLPIFQGSFMNNPAMGVSQSFSDDDWTQVVHSISFYNSTTTTVSSGDADAEFSCYFSIIHFNTPAENAGEPTSDSLYEGNILYAMKSPHPGDFAQITTYHYDSDGYADIKTCKIRGYNDSETVWEVRYSRTTDTTAITSGSEYIEIEPSSVTISEYELDITWHIKFKWEHLDYDNFSIQCTTSDSVVTTTDLYNIEWKVETRLDLQTFDIYDSIGAPGRGDISSNITATGNVVYLGSSIAPSDTAIDVYVISTLSTGTYSWSNTSIVDGSFSMNVSSDSIVGEDTFFAKVVEKGAGESAADLCSTNHDDTYISDQITCLALSSPSFIVDMTAAAEIVVWLQYAFDNDNVTDGTYSLNGVSLSYQAGGTWGVLKLQWGLRVLLTMLLSFPQIIVKEYD